MSRIGFLSLCSPYICLSVACQLNSMRYLHVKLHIFIYSSLLIGFGGMSFMHLSDALTLSAFLCMPISFSRAVKVISSTASLRKNVTECMWGLFQSFPFVLEAALRTHHFRSEVNLFLLLACQGHRKRQGCNSKPFNIIRL